MVIDPVLSNCGVESVHHTEYTNSTEADDHHYTDDHSTDDHSTDDHSSDDHHRLAVRYLLSAVVGAPVQASTYLARRLNSEAAGDDSLDDGFSCEDRYVLSFAIFCAIMLCLFILLVYIVANVYYDRMIEICGNVGFKKSFDLQEGGRANYGKCLDDLIVLENTHEVDHSLLGMSMKLPSVNQEKSFKVAKTLPDLLKTAKREISREVHEEIVVRKEPFLVRATEYIHDIYHGYERQFEELEWREEDGPNPYKGLFVANIPGMFFLAVELSVFVQCLYIAIWATQLLPVAKQSEDGAGWVIILSIPVVLNFFIVRHILVIAVMLKGFIELDHKLVAHVCEELMEESHLLGELGKRVRHKHRKYNTQFAKQNVPLPPIIIMIHMLNQHNHGSSSEFGKVAFRKFLGKHNIFLDHDQFRALWSCIDANLSGTISWDEIFITVFPEMEESIKKLVFITDRLRQKCSKALQARFVGFRKKMSKVCTRLRHGDHYHIPEAEWRIFLDEVAQELQVDEHEDVISIDRFYHMVCQLRVFEGNYKHAAFNKFFREVMPNKTEEYGDDCINHHEDSVHHSDLEYNKKLATITKKEFILLVDPYYYYQEYVTLPDDVYEKDEAVSTRHAALSNSFSFSRDEFGGDGHQTEAVVMNEYAAAADGHHSNGHHPVVSHQLSLHPVSNRKSSNSLNISQDDSDSESSTEGLNSPFSGMKHSAPEANFGTKVDTTEHAGGFHSARAPSPTLQVPVATKLEVSKSSPMLVHTMKPSAVSVAAVPASSAARKHNIPSLHDLNHNYKELAAGDEAVAAIIPAVALPAAASSAAVKKHRIPTLAELNSGVYVPPQSRSAAGQSTKMIGTPPTVDKNAASVVITPPLPGFRGSAPVVIEMGQSSSNHVQPASSEHGPAVAKSPAVEAEAAESEDEIFEV
jgi:hypothetical protein